MRSNGGWLYNFTKYFAFATGQQLLQTHYHQTVPLNIQYFGFQIRKKFHSQVKKEKRAENRRINQMCID